MVSGRWSVILQEELTSTTGPVTFAVTIPRLDASGASPDGRMIWGYGVSVTAAGAIGLAGALVSPNSSTLERIDGNPAIRFDASPGESVRFRWVAGGAIYGDSTAAAWAARAAELLGAGR